jgi:LmbE family N-acetylglucosaminyl deacetylase
MTAPPDPVPVPTGLPIVFYSPHQDDETLFMGQIIAHCVLAGREVHVVLCSNGNTSEARQEINGELLDTGWWKAWHYPAREGYEPLSAAEFGLARTREFRNALAQLGVRPENIHLGRADYPQPTSETLPDSIPPSWATALLQTWADHFVALGYPAVGHYTMYWGDPQADHAAMGTALVNLKTEQPALFTDCRWLVKPEQAVAAGAAAYVVPVGFAAQAKSMSRLAGKAYAAWAPEAGAYAAGYHSVGTVYFDDVEALAANHTVRMT